MMKNSPTSSPIDQTVDPDSDFSSRLSYSYPNISISSHQIPERYRVVPST